MQLLPLLLPPPPPLPLLLLLGRRTAQGGLVLPGLPQDHLGLLRWIA
jgi:hypothetical protein